MHFYFNLFNVCYVEKGIRYGGNIDFPVREKSNEMGWELPGDTSLLKLSFIKNYLSGNLGYEIKLENQKV